MCGRELPIHNRHLTTCIKAAAQSTTDGQLHEPSHDPHIFVLSYDGVIADTYRLVTVRKEEMDPCYCTGDEADSMTGAAQQALRRTMDIYSHSTRFTLACNVSTKIIEPIQSRAAILRYPRLADEQILSRLMLVCAEESVSYSDDGLETILFTAEGDMRNALNNLQATVSGFGHVSQTNVFRVCDQPHPTRVREVVDACLDGGKTAVAVELMTGLWNMGYSSSDIIGTVFKVVKAHNKMGEAIKLEYLRLIGCTHMRIAGGLIRSCSCWDWLRDCVRELKWMVLVRRLMGIRNSAQCIPSSLCTYNYVILQYIHCHALAPSVDILLTR